MAAYLADVNEFATRQAANEIKQFPSFIFQIAMAQ